MAHQSFRDITTGSNGPNGIYNAGPAYDLCTGLGVPSVTSLIPAITSGFPATKSPTIPNAPDFNGDGKDDILWRNSVTGDVYIWLMNGNSIIGAASLGSVDLSWKIVGIGDFNGGGKRDIVWYNTSIRGSCHLGSEWNHSDRELRVFSPGDRNR